MEHWPYWIFQSRNELDKDHEYLTNMLIFTYVIRGSLEPESWHYDVTFYSWSYSIQNAKKTDAFLWVPAGKINSGCRTNSISLCKQHQPNTNAEYRKYEGAPLLYQPNVPSHNKHRKYSRNIELRPSLGIAVTCSNFFFLLTYIWLLSYLRRKCQLPNSVLCCLKGLHTVQYLVF